MFRVMEKIKVYGVKRFSQYTISEIRNKIIMQMIKGSYSQRGEDLVIDKLLGYKNHGFYVDIGAYDPYRFSNTARFYMRGWNGINVEPNSVKYSKFVKNRINDINLNIGIAKERTKLIFYKFFTETLSTFSEEEYKRYLRQGYRIENIFNIDIYTLAEILESYAVDKQIDFMSIDTEGFDMQVLKSNDWSRFRPRVICIESAIHELSKENKDGNVIKSQEIFLERLDYEKILDNGLNSIYRYRLKL